MRMESANRRKGGGYCEYHRDYGHMTNRCINLAKVINQVINNKKDELAKPLKPPQEFLIKDAGSNKIQEEEGIEETIFFIMEGEEEEG